MAHIIRINTYIAATAIATAFCLLASAIL